MKLNGRYTRSVEFSGGIAIIRLIVGTESYTVKLDKSDYEKIQGDLDIMYMIRNRTLPYPVLQSAAPKIRKTLGSLLSHGKPRKRFYPKNGDLCDLRTENWSTGFVHHNIKFTGNTVDRRLLPMPHQRPGHILVTKSRSFRLPKGLYCHGRPELNGDQIEIPISRSGTKRQISLRTQWDNQVIDLKSSFVKYTHTDDKFILFWRTACY
jgi:hypothetical protein